MLHFAICLSVQQQRFKKLQAFYAKHHLYRDLAIASNAIKQLQK